MGKEEIRERMSSSSTSGRQSGNTSGYSEPRANSLSNDGTDKSWYDGLSWPPSKERNSRLGLWCQARSWMAAKAVCLAIVESKMACPTTSREECNEMTMRTANAATKKEILEIIKDLESLHKRFPTIDCHKL